MKHLNKDSQELLKIKVILKNEFSTIEKTYIELTKQDIEFIDDKVQDGYNLTIEGGVK